jgi:hypothetical protein
VRAAKFSEEWKHAHYEKGESQTFYNEFFEVFGVLRRKVATFEEPVKRLGAKAPGFIDLLWKGTLLVEQKSGGRDLIKAKEQALTYFPGLKDAELPRFLLLCNFQDFELYDLDTRECVKFALADLPKHVQAFSFIFGGAPRVFKDQDPVNIQASELMGKLHDALKTSGYEGHDLERLLVRLVFCLFADDTGIFTPKGIFEDFVRDRMRQDGSDTGPLLGQLFEVLNRPTDKRQRSLDEDLREFPYVNGDLFSERLSMPAFDSAMRTQLLNACAFDWSAISPAIFGALFQSVMNKKKRRAIGAHYTTEQNILKLIHPLFLDNLRDELDRLIARGDNARDNALRAFQARLASIRCFDPACGCGNFLVIAYREIRSLETETLLILNANRSFDVNDLSKVDVNQFYGIEIEEFPARIAEIALWMMDHIMNMRLSEALGGYYPRIPLKASPTILPADALEIDWETVLPRDQCSYVFGNPPFAGAKYQSVTQRAQVARIAALQGKKGTLDYVAAWFLKAGAYVQGSRASIAFVATNSITQGEQVAELWPLLFGRCKLEIAFAHRTFAWGSEARGKAHVHVVIIGLCLKGHAQKDRRLFDYPDINKNPIESSVRVISPYLFDASHLRDPETVVAERTRNPGDRPKMQSGTQPLDFEQFVLSDNQKAELLTVEPGAAPFVRPYVGSEGFINGEKTWILALQEATPSELKSLPVILDRLKIVGDKRKASDRVGTQKIAAFPTQYNVTVVPKTPFLVVPKVSSERREYVPLAYMEPPTIPSDLVFVVEQAAPDIFAILTSRMHMAWLMYIGGKLKSDYRYSIGLVYNQFPWPDLTAEKRSDLARLGNLVLASRLSHPKEVLATLYASSTMPVTLRKAHQAVDVAVDKLYRKEPFRGDRQRVEFLLAVYEERCAPLIPSPGQVKKRPKRMA